MIPCSDAECGVFFNKAIKIFHIYTVVNKDIK